MRERKPCNDATSNMLQVDYWMASQTSVKMSQQLRDEEDSIGNKNATQLSIKSASRAYSRTRVCLLRYAICSPGIDIVGGNPTGR